jgi:hypothetical protein
MIVKELIEESTFFNSAVTSKVIALFEAPGGGSDLVNTLA